MTLAGKRCVVDAMRRSLQQVIILHKTAVILPPTIPQLRRMVGRHKDSGECRFMGRAVVQVLVHSSPWSLCVIPLPQRLALPNRCVSLLILRI